MSKQELQTFYIPKNSTKIDDIHDKNNLQLRNINVEVDHQIILTLDDTIKSSEESTNNLKKNKRCILKSNNKSINIAKYSKTTRNIQVKSNFVCYNVNIETNKNEESEENEENREISEKKLSKFKLFRNRLTRNNKKTSKKLSNDEIISLNNTAKETPRGEIAEEHVRGVLEYLSKHKKSDVESINEESRKVQPRTSGFRLLHSRLRPDTSQTSNLIIPDLKYVLTPDTSPETSYPKNDPPPVFKAYGPFKSYLPKTSSSRFVVKNKPELENTEPAVSRELLNVLSEHSKLIKSRENIRYDIIFGNLKNYDSNAIQESEPTEVSPRDAINSESETTVAVVEERQEIEEPQNVSVNEPFTDSSFIDDIIDDLLLVIPPPEKAELTTDALEIVQPIVESLLDEIPRKQSLIEIIPIIEILIDEILKNRNSIPKRESPISQKESQISKKESLIPKKESSIKEIVRKPSSVIAFPLEENVTNQNISEIEIEILEDSSKCNKKCKYKTLCDARRAANKIDNVHAEPNLDNDIEIELKPVVFKECRSKMGSQIPIFKGRKRNKKKIKDVENPNVLEICECTSLNGSDQTRSADFSRDNLKKKNSFETKPVCCAKCIVEDSETIEKELQAYDFILNAGTRNYENLKSTMYDLVLDLTFANTPTQTCNYSTRTDKNIQTNNHVPACTSIEKKKLYMYVPRNNNAARKFHEDPKVLMINKSHHSYGINPNVEIIYKSKYITAHHHHEKVNLQFENQPGFCLPCNNLPTQKECKIFFINPKVKERF